MTLSKNRNEGKTVYSFVEIIIHWLPKPDNEIMRLGNYNHISLINTNVNILKQTESSSL